MASKRVLRLREPEPEQKTGQSMRVSRKTLKRLRAIRQHLITLMSSDENIRTPNFPFDFNNDAAIRLVMSVFAIDYGVDLSGEYDSDEQQE